MAQVVVRVQLHRLGPGPGHHHHLVVQQLAAVHAVRSRRGPVGADVAVGRAVRPLGNVRLVREVRHPVVSKDALK